MCGQYVSYQIYIGEQNQTSIATEAVTTASFFQYIANSSCRSCLNCLSQLIADNYDSRVILEKFFCASLFPKCVVISGGTILHPSTDDESNLITHFIDSYPTPICRNFCDSTYSLCLSYFVSLGLASKLPNCSAIDDQQQPIFPSGMKFSL